jgi:hypothetical protein
MVAISRPSVVALGVVAMALGVASQIHAQAPSCDPLGEIRFIVSQPTNERLSAATVAIHVGDELWAGSFRGDRIARYPLP